MNTVPVQDYPLKPMPKWPGVLLFLLFVTIGLLVYQHYGVSWDEPVQRQMGIVSFDYIFKGDPFLKSYIERDHGVGFELPLIMLEKMLGLEDSSDIYLMRHLASHFFFLIGAFAAYILALNLFRKQWLACLAFLLFVLHPTLYAHSFFNSKDIPFLVAFIFTFTAAEIAFRKQTWGWHLIVGLAAGYATSIRILAIILPAFLGFFYLCDLISAWVHTRRISRASWLYPLTFIVGYCAGTLLFAPVLWDRPLANFVEIYHSLAHFRWINNVLFFGKNYLSTELPWYYIPAYFSITMPMLWLLLGAVGMLWVLVRAAMRPALALQNTTDRNFLLYVACFAAPIIAVIALKSVLLDGWRHFYFIYPSFALLVLYVLHRLDQSRVRWMALGASVIQLIASGWFMYQSHPHQQVYFNELVSHRPEHLRAMFEMDYWGVAYRQGLEFLLKQNAGTIHVYAPTDPTRNNREILNKNDRARVQIEENPEQANYFITNFRGHAEDYPYPVTLYEIQVLNSTIMRVYRIR